MDSAAESQEKAPPHGLWYWPVHVYFSGPDGSKFGKQRVTPRLGPSDRIGHLGPISAAPWLPL